MKLFHPGWFVLGAMAIGACATAVRVESNAGGAGGAGGGNGGMGGMTSSSSSASSSTGQPGTCVTAADCPNSGDQCNMPACINGKCGGLPINELGACEDGKQCTQNDTCQNGVCVGGSEKFCPASDTCHIGSCDVGTDTCMEIPGNDGASCNDNDACTLPGTCSNGTCSSGGQVDCSFLNGTCSVGFCDPNIGCKVMPVNDGTPCDDSLYCTVQDKCVAGQCMGIPNTCAAPGNICMIGSCNEAMKTCVAVPGNDGVACDDQNLCTTGEKCSNGNCVGGLPANNGQMCDDGNGCTLGTTCSNGVCGNPQNMVLQCIGGDGCCPAGCGGNDSDCLYWQSGVLQNVTPQTLTGWTQCYTDTYDVDLMSVIGSVVQTCNKAKLLLACKPVAAVNYTLVAMGLRADVLFDCGSGNNCTHAANGVGWYYSATWSWGFANAGDQVARNECDVLGGPLRLCWHTVSNAGGYRCGDTTGLNNDPTWKRVVMHAD